MAAYHLDLVQLLTTIPEDPGCCTTEFSVPASTRVVIKVLDGLQIQGGSKK